MESSMTLSRNPHVQLVINYCPFYLLNNPSFLLSLPYSKHTLIIAHVIAAASKTDHLAASFLFDLSIATRILTQKFQSDLVIPLHMTIHWFSVTHRMKSKLPNVLWLLVLFLRVEMYSSSIGTVLVSLKLFSSTGAVSLYWHSFGHTVPFPYNAYLFPFSFPTFLLH